MGGLDGLAARFFAEAFFVAFDASDFLLRSFDASDFLERSLSAEPERERVTEKDGLMDQIGRDRTREYEVYQADLSPEAALFWRAQCEIFEGKSSFADELKISEDQRDAKLEALVGALVQFCDRIEKVWKVACAKSGDTEDNEEDDVAELLGEMDMDDSSDEEIDAPLGTRGSVLSQQSTGHIDEDMAATQEFVCRQLLVTARSFDFSDEMGRQRLISLLSKMLEDAETPAGMINCIAETFMVAHAEASESSLGLVTIISDVTVPSSESNKEGITIEEREQKEAQVKILKMMIEEKNEEKQAAISTEDYTAAKRLKEEIEIAQEQIMSLEESLELQTGEWRWIRAFEIAGVLLSKTRTTLSGDHYIAPLVHTLIEPALNQAHLNSHPMIREGAARCLALYCLLDTSGDVAKLYLNTLITFARVDPEVHVRIAAIKGLTDLLMVFTPAFAKRSFHAEEHVKDGAQAKDDSVDVNIFMNDAITLMREYAEMRVGENTMSGDATDTEEDGMKMLRIAAVDGLARLSFIGRTKRKDVLQRLVLLPHAADTEKFPAIRQCLAVFLPTFSRISTSNRSTLESAAIDIMEEICFPQANGPSYSTKNVSTTVGNFLLHMLGEEETQKGDEPGAVETPSNASCSHGRFGRALAVRFLAEPALMDAKGMVKTFCFLSISKNDFTNAYLARYAAEEILQMPEECYTDKVGRKALGRLATSLGKRIAKAPASVSDEFEAALNLFKGEVEAMKPVALEAAQEREAIRARDAPKTGRKKSTTVKKTRKRRKLKSTRRTSLSDDEGSVPGKKNLLDVIEQEESNDSSENVIADAVTSKSSRRPSVMRAQEAMNEINNLLSSDDEEM